MQVGDVFTLTDDAIAKIDDSEHYNISWIKGKGDNKQVFTLKSGMQFRISPTPGLTLLPVEVSASMLDSDTGKAKRGRPRRFPADVVAELLGEDPSKLTAVTPAAPVVADDTGDLSDGSDDAQNNPVAAPVPVAVAATETSDEERAAREARVNELLGLTGDDSESDDW